jgi:phosphoribosylglycinamide formyltransferase-1
LKNIVVLISGRGSNLQALLRASELQDWPHQLGASVAAVISNRPDAEGLQVAREYGVTAEVLDHREYPDRDAFDTALAQSIDRHAPQLVVLAGFMRVLGNAFVARYQGRMINIHPSLLPAFAGLHTHRRAIESGARQHGATVHFVTPNLDHGPIIAQSAVDVMPQDTEATLAARVLGLEHDLLPTCVRNFLEGKVEFRPAGYDDAQTDLQRRAEIA